jgi:hypothetical protein
MEKKWEKRAELFSFLKNNPFYECEDMDHFTPEYRVRFKVETKLKDDYFWFSIPLVEENELIYYIRDEHFQAIFGESCEHLMPKEIKNDLEKVKHLLYQRDKIRKLFG